MPYAGHRRYMQADLGAGAPGARHSAAAADSLTNFQLTFDGGI